jgi:hypothetical protein
MNKVRKCSKNTTHTVKYQVPFVSTMIRTEAGDMISILEVPVLPIEKDTIDNLVFLIEEKFGLEPADTEAVIRDLQRRSIVQTLSKVMVPYRQSQEEIRDKGEWTPDDWEEYTEDDDL